MEPNTAKQELSANDAVSHYAASLEAFASDTTNANLLLDVLLQRDLVCRIVATNSVTGQLIQRLSMVDRRLVEITSKISTADWHAWRRALHPPPESWWWRIDELQSKADERRYAPLLLLAGLFMTITLSLATDISKRLWSAGPDHVAILSIIFTIILTGNPLTKCGRDLANWLTNKLSYPTPYKAQMVLAAAIFSFFFAVICWAALPAYAIRLNNRGYTQLQAGDLSAAQQAFRRAVNVNQDYTAAYYNLAEAYVAVSDYNEALILYNKVLTVDRNFDLAYSGLGYLFILRGEPNRAIPLLYTGLDQAKDDISRTAMWTNLGWAYLESRRFYEAEEALRQALSLNSQQGTAHCALALAAEQLKRPQQSIVSHWENCLRNSPPSARGRDLALMARAHLNKERRISNE